MAPVCTQRLSYWPCTVGLGASSRSRTSWLCTEGQASSPLAIIMSTAGFPNPLVSLIGLLLGPSGPHLVCQLAHLSLDRAQLGFQPADPGDHDLLAAVGAL